MNREQTGFSLLELVIVIVVIGLLAVTALPRFLEVVDGAKEASIEGVASGFGNGVISARAQWEAEARPSKTIDGVTYNVVNYDGTEFWLTRSVNPDGTPSGFRDGYPIDLFTEVGNSSIQLTDSACINLMENLLQNPPKVDTVDNAKDNSSIHYSAQALPNTHTCVYTQLEGSTRHKFEYEVATGRVTVTLQ